MKSRPGLCLLPDTFAVCRLRSGSVVPQWAMTGPLWSVSQSPDELSIVCQQSQVPTDVSREGGWRALKVEGPLDFALTGVLSSIASPLAAAEVSIFAVSTFDTDYVLVKQGRLQEATLALSSAGFSIQGLL